jgi:hypothetical protein
MIAIGLVLAVVCLAEVPSLLRIDSVTPAAPGLQTAGRDLIWFDDFDGAEKPYSESSGGLDEQKGFGGAGRSMICLYRKGERGIGDRKVFFGDSPTGVVARKGEKFEDLYWRVYVKHQAGWTGGGEAKLSRITSIVSPRWDQAMIGHVWSSGETLTLDPATGVRDGRVVTTRYNDFANLRWLGNRPAARLPMSSRNESGWWTCVEARVKLNTPGRSDGLMQLWVDGRLEAERTQLDWRGTYTTHGLNAVFLESYWNEGSPVTQTRWLDNFAISTRRIGPIVVPRRPTILLGGPSGPHVGGAWQVELAGSAGDVVWRSGAIRGPDRVAVDRISGEFVGALSGEDRLAPDVLYYGRVRAWTADTTADGWSFWHQGFQTVAK